MQKPGSQTIKKSCVLAYFPAQSQLPGTTWLDTVRSTAGWTLLHQLSRKGPQTCPQAHLAGHHLVTEVASQVCQLPTNANSDSDEIKLLSHSLDFKLKTIAKRAGIFPFPGCWSVYNKQTTTQNTECVVSQWTTKQVWQTPSPLLEGNGFLGALWEMTVVIGRSQERLRKLNPENIYWANSKNSKTVINQTGVGGLKLTSPKQSFFADDANWRYIYIKKCHTNCFKILPV